MELLITSEKKTNGQIEKEIKITASSVYFDRQPQNVALFDDHQKYFCSQDKSKSWICFDFKENHIIPTGYSIRSCPYTTGGSHPKSWVIECSNDNVSWETVDEEEDLNGKNKSHTFFMSQQKSTEFRYIRMRNTGPDWYKTEYLALDSFEIYGQYIINN